MLNINCIVCTDTFTQTDEVFVTRCGHLFHKACIFSWLQRVFSRYINEKFTFSSDRSSVNSEPLTLAQEKFWWLDKKHIRSLGYLFNTAYDKYGWQRCISSETCPQCRNNCTTANINKVYFNLDTGNTIDNGTVNELLDSANLQIKESERNRKKAEERIVHLTQTQHELRGTIDELKEKLKENNGTIVSYFEEVRRLTKDIIILRNETTNIQSDLQREIKTRKIMEERLQGLDCVVADLESELRSSEEIRKFFSYVLDTVKITFSHFKWLAHEKARIAGWKFVWARDGKILARKEEGTSVLHIACIEDLCKIV